jgi:hypothetical protein
MDKRKEGRIRMMIGQTNKEWERNTRERWE